MFETALRAQNIPYDVSGGQSLFDRTEIKDFVAYLRLIANDDDDPAFVRAVTTPKRGVGQATLAQLGDIAAARHESLFAAAFAAGRWPARFRRGSARRSTQFCALDQRPALPRGARAGGPPARRAARGDRLRGLAGGDARQARGEGADAERARFRRLARRARARADERNLLELTQMVALITMLEGSEGEARGRGAAVDAARGEGPRVPARVPGRAGGGPAAAPRGGRGGQRRRGAPADVRRPHARAADRCTCRAAAGASARAR